MKKFIYVALTLSAIFVNSHALALEAKTPCMAFSQALKNVKNKSDFATLKKAKFGVQNKIYVITYLNKEGGIETIKINQVNGKEVM